MLRCWWKGRRTQAAKRRGFLPPFHTTRAVNYSYSACPSTPHALAPSQSCNLHTPASPRNLDFTGGLLRCLVRPSPSPDNVTSSNRLDPTWPQRTSYTDKASSCIKSLITVYDAASLAIHSLSAFWRWRLGPGYINAELVRGGKGLILLSTGSTGC